MAIVFDDKGNVIRGAYVAGDGKTYLADGSRLPAGYRVQTTDGNLWEMGKDGKGTLVRDMMDRQTGSSNPLTGAKVNNFDTPEVRKGTDLADLFNISNDVKEIERMMRKAADAKFDDLDKAYAKMEGQFGDNLAKAADAAQGVIRRTRNSAIQDGVSNARDATAQLTAMLGIGQAGAQGAQDIALSRAQLEDTRAAERAAVPQKALEYVNTLNEGLGKLAYQLNSNDIARYGADMNALVGLDANYSGLLAQNGTNESNLQIAALQAKAQLDSIRAGASRAVSTGQTTQESAMEQMLAQAGQLAKNMGAGPAETALWQLGILNGFNPDAKQLKGARDKDRAVSGPAPKLSSGPPGYVPPAIPAGKLTW